MAKSPLRVIPRAKSVPARSGAKATKHSAKAPKAIATPTEIAPIEMVAPISSIDQDNPTIGFYFDARWYLERYPDVADAGIDAAEHFMSIGFREGRDPNPAFITLDYFAANPDLNSSDTINPFLHYILYGASERRRLKPT